MVDTPFNWFTQFRLKTPLDKFYNGNQGLSLTSKGATLLSDKTGKTPLDNVLCASESFKRTQKGSSYYERTLITNKQRGTTTYKSKMKNRIGVNLRQNQIYVNRVATMLNNGIIPPGNSDILNRFILGKKKTR